MWRLLGALVLLISAARLSEAQPNNGISPYSIRSNNETCLYDDDCALSRFCLHPPNSNLRGTCAQCWRCCLFPGVWGTCPLSCNCNVGSACSYPSDCGQGTFCAVNNVDSTAPPTCQLCSSCVDDTEAVFGTCGSSCVSASLAAAGFTSVGSAAAQTYVFLSYLASEVSPSTALSVEDGFVRTTDVASWIDWEGLVGRKASALLAAIAQSNTVSIPVTSFITTLSSQSVSSLECPSLATVPIPITVDTGCACNASLNAETFKCAAGDRCSKAALHQLSTEALENPTMSRLGAICVACEFGQYCPTGTFIQNESDLSSLECPSASYCPTPAELRPCPPGSYCVARDVAPRTCDYSKLLMDSPFEPLRMDNVTVLQRLRDYGDPYRGNYCPANSTKPNNICDGGYYCPDASIAIKCPQGYFCKPQSLSPQKCHALMMCPPGTSTPRWSALAFVIIAIIVGSLPVMYYVLDKIDSSSTRYEDLERFELKRNRAIKVTRQLLQSIKSRSMAGAASEMNAEMQAKYAGFGMIDPRIRLDFEQLGLILPGKGKVLNGVSGHFPPGKMNAVMGPSGSGKTTFLNVLGGKAAGEVIGTVLVNGIPMPIGQTRQVTGFVPQDDIVHEDLTVRENLAYAAHLKLPRDLADTHRRSAVIDDALEMLQLKQIQHYRVGSVEKKGHQWWTEETREYRY